MRTRAAIFASLLSVVAMAPHIVTAGARTDVVTDDATGGAGGDVRGGDGATGALGVGPTGNQNDAVTEWGADGDGGTERASDDVTRAGSGSDAEVPLADDGDLAFPTED